MSQQHSAAPHTAEPARVALDDAAPLPVEVHRVLPEQWRAHRDLRLDMLEADPDAFWADLGEVRSRTEEQWREEIAGPRIHLQARVGETVLGGIALLPEGYTPEHPIPADRSHIVSLWVRPAARGRGISTLLLRSVAELAISIGRPELSLDVDETNASARAVYERLGFRATGEREPREGRDSAWIEYMLGAEELLRG
ncbi:MAG: GNAT family N-acetyltransferase [Brachybacterium paraconglomeratum]|nr:GNAT family N-acetyltransferase [Brachybacterium paraconglomeratum]